MKINELFENILNLSNNAIVPTFIYKKHKRILGHMGHYQKENTISITMILNNKKVGYIEVVPKLKKIEILFINPKYQRKGYAKILMNKVLSEFNIDNLEVIVSDSGMSVDQLINFYKNYGFKVVKKTFGQTGDPVMKRF